MLRLPALLAILTLAGLPASAAARVPFTGPKIPHGRVTYVNRMPKADAWAVNYAIHQWTGSGARVTFVRTTSEARATVVIRAGKRLLYGPGVTFKRLNPKTGKPQNLTLIDKGSRDRYVTAMLIAHELGHVLGLDHSGRRECAVMNPGFYQACAFSKKGVPSGKWVCGLVRPRDVAPLVRAYGGHARRPKQDLCDMTEAEMLGAAPPQPVGPPALTLASVTPSAGGASVTLSWDPFTPAKGEYVSLSRYQGPCAAAPDNPESLDYVASTDDDPPARLTPSGGTYTDALPADRYPPGSTMCYILTGVTMSDKGYMNSRYGIANARATVELTVPAPG